MFENLEATDRLAELTARAAMSHRHPEQGTHARHGIGGHDAPRVVEYLIERCLEIGKLQKATFRHFDIIETHLAGERPVHQTVRPDSNAYDTRGYEAGTHGAALVTGSHQECIELACRGNSELGAT